MKNNKEFFDNVSESIAKYNPTREGILLSNSTDVVKYLRKEFNGDIYDQEHFLLPI